MATYTDKELQIIHVGRKAVAGKTYVSTNDVEYIGTLVGTLKYVTDNFSKKAITSVGNALQNSSNVDMNFNEETLEIDSDLTETGVSAGTYGNATNVVQVTIDEYGRIIAITTIPVASDFITAIADTSTIHLDVTLGTLSADFIGDSDDVPEGATNLYFLESRVLATLLAGISISGGSITAADSVLGAFGKLQNQINSLVGGVLYKGTWNANTNSPALASGVGTKGWYYVVSVPGSTNLDGITDWKLGDWAIFNGTAWEKVDNTDAVISVNGQTGVVVLTTTDIAEGSNLYFTNASVLATALTGLSTATAQVIAASDTIVAAMGYLQAQVTNIRAGQISAVFSGGGGVVSTGSKGYLTIGYGFTITGFYIIGNTSGSCVVDIKVGGVSIIGGGNKPTLSSAQRANAAVSGWTTTTFSANTEIEWNVDSCSTISEIDLTIKLTKAIS